jgi:hypothetical protein
MQQIIEIRRRKAMKLATDMPTIYQVMPYGPRIYFSIQMYSSPVTAY